MQSPFLWGSLSCAAFYGAVEAIGLTGPARQFIDAYFTAHPVDYAETAMFFVGMAALVIKLMHIAVQHQRVGEKVLGPTTAGGEPVGNCQTLLARLDRLPEGRAGEYLVRRLRNALEYVRRRGSPESLDDELKYLADVDAVRVQEGFALVRVIIWVIPILGFLGTVIGITIAVANLSPTALERSLPDVVAGLSVAFNTTAQALGLSMVLVFSQLFVDRAAGALLSRVDQQAEEELIGRFEQISSSPDGQVVAVRRMAETLIKTTEQLVRRQAELWQASIETAAQRWTAMADTAEKRLQSALAGALSENVKHHARELASAEQAAAQENRRHWDRVQQGLTQNAEALAGLQNGLARQVEMIGRAVEATGQIARLEDTLNRNLAALAGSKNFEQTVMSLAAAIHLLNARLGDMPAGALSVQLETARRTGHAA
jgi:biopolymer transport protein ExbB/TolQ